MLGHLEKVQSSAANFSLRTFAKMMKASYMSYKMGDASSSRPGAVVGSQTFRTFVLRFASAHAACNLGNPVDPVLCCWMGAGDLFSGCKYVRTVLLGEYVE